eukprot:8080056-Ditylum_brightwellii.AAC.1
MAQQPNFDSCYPFGLTVKWQDKQKLRLATVLRTNEGRPSDTTCTIRLLNSTKEVNVPIKDLSPCTTNNPADIPTSVKDIDPNAMESLLTHEDSEKL